MGLRLRKKIRLFPGVSVNVSNTGISTSIGRAGAMLNIGRRGARGTVGLPGTGMSYSEQLTSAGTGETPTGMSFGALLLWCVLVLFVGLILYVVLVG